MANHSTHADDKAWPALPYEEWADTYATVHMWCQMIGKVRLTLTPWTNHSWHVTQYVTPRGLTTGPIPHGAKTFQIDLDFIDHLAKIETSDGATRALELAPRTAASFYTELMGNLRDLGCPVTIHTMPNEVPNPIPFEQDEQHASYDPEYTRLLSRVLLQVHNVFTEFRARFLGKSSPVHFFWGSFDLAVTRFSGRKAPVHPGGVPGLPDWVTREAYSHEVSSAGFWPGNESAPALFYSYAYPTPDGFSEAAAVKPSEAYFFEDLGEFVLPYDAVRRASSPESVLLDFLQSTYEVAADLASWDRDALEFKEKLPPAAR